MQLPTIAAVATALLVLTGGVAGLVAADTDDEPTAATDGDGRLQPFLGLTDEQLTELTDMVERMRADGASATEVWDAVEAQLLAWDVPQERIDALQRHLHARHHHAGAAMHAADALRLSDDERTELHDLVHAMRADGATREEVRDAVHARLNDWGYTDDEIQAAALQARLTCLSERRGLSDTETATLMTGAEERREDGATRADIREYVRETLTEWGYLDSDDGRHVGPDGDRPVGPPNGHGVGPRGVPA